MRTYQKLTLIAVIVVVIAAASATTTVVLAQQQQQGEVFESEDDGFRLQIPAGWAIEDFENIPEPTDPNIENVAMLCLESEALPGIGGESNCLVANGTDSINIVRLPDLQSRPEFEDNAVVVPTTNDLVALYIQDMQNSNTSSDIKIENTTDIDEFTKIANMTYTVYNDAGTPFNPYDDYTQNNKGLFMFVLSPADNNTGYILFNVKALEHEDQIFTQHKPGVQEVFNSFQIVESGGGE